MTTPMQYPKLLESNRVARMLLRSKAFRCQGAELVIISKELVMEALGRQQIQDAPMQLFRVRLPLSLYSAQKFETSLKYLCLFWASVLACVLHHHHLYLIICSFLLLEALVVRFGWFSNFGMEMGDKIPNDISPPAIAKATCFSPPWVTRNFPCSFLFNIFWEILCALEAKQHIPYDSWLSREKI